MKCQHRVASILCIRVPLKAEVVVVVGWDPSLAWEASLVSASS